MGQRVQRFSEPAQATIRVAEILIEIGVALRFDLIWAPSLRQRRAAPFLTVRLVDRQRPREGFERLSIPTRYLLRPLVDQDVALDPVQRAERRQREGCAPLRRQIAHDGYGALALLNGLVDISQREAFLGPPV